MNNNSQKIEEIFLLEDFNDINIEKFRNIIRGNIDLGLSLLFLFKEQSHEYLRNLEKALKISHENPKQLLEATHAIKGASLTIAADKVSTIASKIEAEIRDTNKFYADDYDKLIELSQNLLNYIIAIELRQIQNY